MLAISLYLLPIPAGLSANAWHLFAIFIGSIALVMFGVFPMGLASMMGLTAALVTGIMSFLKLSMALLRPLPGSF